MAHGPLPRRRAAATPIDDLLDRLDEQSADDPGAAPLVPPSPTGEGPLDAAEIQAGIDALDLPAEFTARQRWWSEWDRDRGTVSRFDHDPDIGDIESLVAVLRQRHADGHVIEICTYRRSSPRG